jgi:hypothetical protein
MPGVNLSTLCCGAYGWVVSEVTAVFVGQQFSDVFHDGMPDLIELFTAFTTPAGDLEWAEWPADAQVHMRAFPGSQISENVE